MSARTLSQRTSLVAVGGELRYTTSRLVAHEEGAPFVAEFQGLCQKKAPWCKIRSNRFVIK